MITLYEHQRRLVQQNPAKYLLAHQMGTGKTITSLALAKANGVRPVISVPKPVKKKWAKAAEDMGVDALVLGREEFRKLAKTYDFTGYDAIIIDEAHYGFPTQKSQMHKAALFFIKKYQIKYIWLLTGTPYTSTPWSVYGLATLLGFSWPYFAFRDRFFKEQWLGRRSIWVPKEGMQEELAACVRQIGNIVRLEECVDMPEQTYEVETFKKNKTQENAEKAIQEIESNPLVRTTKYHQIASGVTIGNEFVDDAYFECDKNERILNYAADVEKLVIFSRYNIHLEYLARDLRERGVPHAIVNGSTVDKEEVFANAEEAKRFVLLINASCSVGYELPSFSTVIFASLSYSFVDYAQACGRVLRINNMKPNLYIIMLTEDSVDEAVWASIKNKESFNDAIFSRTNLDQYETR